jgi:hypothetical protein
MDYNITIYRTNGGKTARFALGTEGKNPLFVIGLNPSTADDERPDPTIRRVMGFAERNGFDSFVMINLYPLRATNPAELPVDMDKELFKGNLFEIEKLVSTVHNPTILVSWGDGIYRRPYLEQCVKSIYEAIAGKNVRWKQIGSLTKGGQPRHPSRVAYSSFSDFDMDAYITHLN